MHSRAWTRLVLSLFMLSGLIAAQDASTGAVRGTVSDPLGARVSAARIVVMNEATGVAHTITANEEGEFVLQMLLPGEYAVRAEAPGFASQQYTRIAVDLGAQVELHFSLQIGIAKEAVTVNSEAAQVETQVGEASSVVDQRAIAELPINGRRFSDLALLTPGVTQDPRSLTSASNGDLAFGGIRGFQTSYLVDGADNNNGFFAQARGRYRAPYQFSNEVIQEFRVSSNNYGAELGRSSSAVINVVTRSGANVPHGTMFYYVRDKIFDARQPFLNFTPDERQQQFGATLGGPIKKNRAFYYFGFDQHIFHIPTVVQFANGSLSVVPTPSINASKGDYEPCTPAEAAIGGPSCDQALVFAAAQQLSQMGGSYRTKLLGNAGFAKADWIITPQHQFNARLSTSRFYGANNVYFDPASPITHYAISNNGEEDVSTESGTVSLTSAWTSHVTSHLRLQFSRDLQQSSANSSGPEQAIYGVISGIGRASILPRETREHRLHLAETINLERRRHSLKFGTDAVFTWTRDFFPSMFGGEYEFDTIKVNPWTFQPQPYGLELTPLRAYAHQVPRYYMQAFGNAISHPDTNEYAWFLQDAIRVTNHLGLTLGLRYDLQTFRTDGLTTNPLWPASGKLPSDTNNYAPRVGFAYSFGEERPVVLRGGWGIFYARIPQMYASAVATNNGINNEFLFLDNAKAADQTLFPIYPAPLVQCGPQALSCAAPASVVAKLSSSTISAFAPDFRTPMSQQASLGLQKELAHRFVVRANYLYVHGEHLIRARDVNLPPPTPVQYPVYDQNGTFLNQYYIVESFVPWQTSISSACTYPPCLGPLVRPIPQLGAITQFESAASSVYHGLTISAQRRMLEGVYFRLAYTWSHAIDNVQDALLTTGSSVQNSYATAAERGASVTDQRQRLVVSWITEPRPFDASHPRLRTVFNGWKWSGTVTIGSGRPVNTRVTGDPNGDGNSNDDRLPGVGRNRFYGPGYQTADVRLARKLRVSGRLHLEVLAEIFNLLNHDNKRLDINDTGFQGTVSEFISYSKIIGNQAYPAYFRNTGNFLQPTSSYTPRQLQLALRFAF